MEKKYFTLSNSEGNKTVSLYASDLIKAGFSNSSAYRAIKTGYMPKEKYARLQLQIFGTVPGWDGWTILPNEIISPCGLRHTAKDLQDIITWHQFMLQFED